MVSSSRNLKVRTGGWLFAGLLLLSAVGCSSGPHRPRCNSAPGLMLVVGVHRNMAASDVSETIGCVIRATINAGQPVGVVAVDGTPSVLTGTAYQFDDANNDAKREQMVEQDLNQVVTAVRQAAADSPGSDLLTGIRLAAAKARALNAPTAEIVVIDSGLPDTGPLNLTVPGMLSADPADVTKLLTAEIRALGVRGMKVTLDGFGYTSRPQEPLTGAQTASVVALWTAVLQAAGAKVEHDPDPRAGPGPQTQYATKPVALPKPVSPNFCSPQTIVYDDASPIGFLPSSNDFRDRPAAKELLRGLATWLTAVPGRKASITGTTSSAGTEAQRVARSHGRADAVKALLVNELGVEAGQVTTDGVATHFTGYVPDRRPDGSLDPIRAVRNRTVRIVTAQSHNTCEPAKG
ncbi:OmpA family protein [Kribbella sp. VKM Ac-2566]|uniref:OmpA family protein n=1 Tax=Kribbella sp. VKM Ac-2566 TaxID=2512218 RepID=UPI001063038F|nr:OmpA family protein [Kribbella sp. VKM Ac-2566]TDX03234.1 OmpA family protein [Kribbella sp. VKM Ac-2566]